MAFISSLWKGSVNTRLAELCQTSSSCHSFYLSQKAFWVAWMSRKRLMLLNSIKILTPTNLQLPFIHLLSYTEKNSFKSWTWSLKNACWGINTHSVLMWQRQPPQLRSWSAHIQQYFYRDKQKNTCDIVTTSTEATNDTWCIETNYGLYRPIINILLLKKDKCFIDLLYLWYR